MVVRRPDLVPESADSARLVWLGLAVILVGILLFVVYRFIGTFTLGVFRY